MPFEQRIPHPLTTAGALAHAPAAPGVYGLSNAREWVYIGQADNIQDALMGHLGGLDATVQKREPKGFVFEICAGDQRRLRQDRLVLEYEPICNRISPRQRESALKRHHSE